MFLSLQLPMTSLWFYTLLFTFINAYTHLDATLVHVQLLYRHGDRSPVGIYPKSNYNQSAWPMGLGQLTTQGIRQHFRLGSFLKQRYANFMSELYQLEEIHVRSTDYERTLMSAESHLAGFYYLANPADRWNTSIPWSPVPVHTIPAEQDIMLVDTPCPRYNELEQEVLDSDAVKHVEVENQDLLDLLSRESGIPNVQINTLWSIYDTLYCQRQHNMTLPTWVTPDVWNRMHDLNDYGWLLMFYNPELTRLRAGVLLEAIVQQMQDIVAGKKNVDGKKMISYSGHDTDVAALLSSLSVFNRRQPPYASCVLMELHHDAQKPQSSAWFVRLFYHNASVDASQPYDVIPLTLPQCSQDCSLTDFISITASERMTAKQHDKACQTTLSTLTNLMHLKTSLLLLLLILLMVCLIFLQGCQPRRKYVRPFHSRADQWDPVKVKIVE